MLRYSNLKTDAVGGWVGGWVGSGERIMPLCGPSCKLRLSRSSAMLRFQDRPSMAIGLEEKAKLYLNESINKVLGLAFV